VATDAVTVSGTANESIVIALQDFHDLAILVVDRSFDLD